MKTLQSLKNPLLVGIDAGSTTAKIAVLEKNEKKLIHSRYVRHNAEQGKTITSLLEEAHTLFPDREFVVSFCGSAGEPFARASGGFFIQEVVANTLAVKEFYPQVRVAIELGGQDAKVIFFDYDKDRQQLSASDMRMNGSCAGGTGAFIDQVAELLDIQTEEYNHYAARGENLYEISGRCGVFAKTDIQPLLNQGVAREDIALSAFHALAKQTIGGLAQGMTISPKVIFEGGPLTFNPVLIRVFKERLMLKDEDIIVPENPELIVACGAALAALSMYRDEEILYSKEKALKGLKDLVNKKHLQGDQNEKLFFETPEEQTHFQQKHALPPLPEPEIQNGEVYNVYLGIDAGSTTSKFVLLDEEENLVDSFYSGNRGEPLKIIQQGLLTLRKKYEAKGARLNILGVGTTGYGENLFARGFKADFHCVETVAHARAARQYAPEVSFILDIGGQDMKAISLKNGIVSGIVLNEACSAGCGSFVETYARSLGIAMEEIAGKAFEARHPSRLGSRCTVFMNSSIITEQKNGKTTGDILAGICRSIIENVFTKVVRINNFDKLGETVVVQGGTFKNDAVLRAFEQYSGRNVFRAPYPGEMGAIGIALLTREHVMNMKKLSREMGKPWKSRFIGLDKMEEFSYSKQPGQVCPFCSNHCNRTVVSFSDGSRYITGNRCEKGEVLGDLKDETVRQKVQAKSRKMAEVPDLMCFQREQLLKDYPVTPLCDSRKIKIGIPRALEFWYSLPYWKTLFQALGFEVVVSPASTYRVFDKALPFVPSDTICFPAKLLHGHVEMLLEKGVDRIFIPQMIRMPRENESADHGFFCAILQGYSMVVEKSNEPRERYRTRLDRPIFHWFNEELKLKQLKEFFKTTFDIDSSLIKEAHQQASQAMALYRKTLKQEGRRVLEDLEKENRFAVLLAGRPYHMDILVNHDLSRHFTRLGIPVMTLDALEESHDVDLKPVRMESTITYHNRMMESTLQVARNPRLELVQIVSFGCGHDAIISDEMTRVLRESSGKEMLVLKVDEGEATGPLNIRIKSFIETIRARKKEEHKSGPLGVFKELKEAFPVKFEREHKQSKTIYIPNLSPAFTYCMSEILKKTGYRVEPLPLADEKAMALGKKYVHNDICFPAQINIGEFLTGLEDGRIDPQNAAFGLAKNCEACRAGQYPALARKALDEAGYPNIPVLTTGVDTKDMHPGFAFTLQHQLNALWGLTIIDALERMRRRIRPYEKEAGRADALFDVYMKQISRIVPVKWNKAMQLFEQAIGDFNEIEVNQEEKRRPRVAIIGEILMNYHPSANGFIERYLEDHGMEVVVPDMHDFFRKNAYIDRELGKKGWAPEPFLFFLKNDITGKAYDFVHRRVQKKMKAFLYGDEGSSVHNLAKNVEDNIDLTYRGGEGWKIPAEIIEMEKHGVNSFVIVQPFGCLPNHITGRGFIKPLKKQMPHIQILSLDYDPDTSFANIENRLQMLIINAREKERAQGISS